MEKDNFWEQLGYVLWGEFQRQHGCGLQIFLMGTNNKGFFMLKFPKSVGERNELSKRTVDIANASEMDVVETYFWERAARLSTGGN